MVSYGGGDQLQTTNQIYARKLPFKISDNKEDVPQNISFVQKKMMEKMWKSVGERYQENERIHRDQKVFHFPQKIPNFEEIDFQFVINISTQFYR